MSQRLFGKPSRFEGVLYDPRGALAREAKQMENQGIKIYYLNIGNTKPFGLDAPDEIIENVTKNIRKTEGYPPSAGIFPAQEAILQHCQTRDFQNLILENIFTTDGVSDAIFRTMMSFLEYGDEILVPMPDYPLWTGAIKLLGGKPVHYVCDEKSDWLPDLKDIRRKITSKTKGIVIIPFNNPTGALYSREILEKIIKICQENQLALFSDEIYDKIIYGDGESISVASLADDILIVTYNGLAKAYRVPGWKAGWATVSGNTKIATGFLEALNLICDMRLGSNHVGQMAVQTALGGYQSIKDLVKPGGRLREQRDLGYELLNGIDGISCVMPKAGLYFFPRIDVKKFNIKSDEQFLLDLLREKHVLLGTGTGFNWPKQDHFRVVFLPHVHELKEVLTLLADFLSTYRQK